MTDLPFFRTSLGQRILTAAALIPIVLIGIFYVPNLLFSLIIGLIMLLGAWEWSVFLGLKAKKHKLLYMLAVFVSICLIAQLSASTVYLFAGLWWLVAFFAVCGYPKNVDAWNSPISIGTMGCITLSIAWFAMTDLQSTEHGSRLVLLVMCIIWGADTGAYFAGRRWGVKKLAPAVSPGKSIAGLLGGMAVTLVFTFLVLLQLDLAGIDKIYYLFLILITVLFSVIGDLYESMLKRNVNIKDSGSILPGHGGVMDRIDSLTAAVPLFSAGLYFNGAFISI